jgi:hypothetical protein
MTFVEKKYLWQIRVNIFVFVSKAGEFIEIEKIAKSWVPRAGRCPKRGLPNILNFRDRNNKDLFSSG